MGVRAKKTRRTKVVKIIGKTPKNVHRPRASKHNPVHTNEVDTKNMSLDQAYAAMGLQNTPGLAGDRKLRILQKVPDKYKKAPPAVPDPKPSQTQIVTDTEHGYLQILSEKYGGDYKAMARDVKLNPFQYTPKQLRKMFLKVVRFEQRMDPAEFKEVYGKQTPEEIVGDVSDDEW
ncbi:hypothetical protein DIPPA_18793 [Diplonema papillatum]|nr:hypothetical protein DIPPA_18793 [Diplonema papillatum]|eukprot:gene5549-8438_t